MGSEMELVKVGIIAAQKTFSIQIALHCLLGVSGLWIEVRLSDGTEHNVFWSFIGVN